MTSTSPHGLGSPMPPARPSLIWRLMLAALSLLLSLALVEGAARWTVPPAIPRMALYRPAADVGYELIPGAHANGPLGEAIVIDERGQRALGPAQTGRALDPRGPADRGDAPREARILAVGDSFTFGLGVAPEATYPIVAGRALGVASVTNAGVPGYNLWQEVRWLESRAAAADPSMILLGLVENDLHNVDGPDFVANADGTLRERDGSFRASSTLNPFAALAGPWLDLQLHSAAFRAISFAAIRGRLAVSGDPEIAELAAVAESSTALPDRLLRGEEDAETKPRFAAAGSLLTRAAAAAHRLGVPLVVVLLPRPEQLFSPRLRGGFARLAESARQAGLVVVDPAEAMAAENGRIGFYLFPNDHHPSARGHAAIATALAPALRPLLDGARPADVTSDRR